MKMCEAMMDCKTLKRNLDETTAFLQKRLTGEPSVTLFMGTGLGSVSDQMNDKITIPYEEIPSFPKPSAFGQSNVVAAGTVSGKYVISFEGRFHAYEGHPFQEIGFPVRVAHALGAKVFIGTNIYSRPNVFNFTANVLLTI